MSAEVLLKLESAYFEDEDKWNTLLEKLERKEDNCRDCKGTFSIVFCLKCNLIN